MATLNNTNKRKTTGEKTTKQTSNNVANSDPKKSRKNTESEVTNSRSQKYSRKKSTANNAVTEHQSKEALGSKKSEHPEKTKVPTTNTKDNLPKDNQQDNSITTLQNRQKIPNSPVANTISSTSVSNLSHTKSPTKEANIVSSEDNTSLEKDNNSERKENNFATQHYAMQNSNTKSNDPGTPNNMKDPQSQLKQSIPSKDVNNEVKDHKKDEGWFTNMLNSLKSFLLGSTSNEQNTSSIKDSNSKSGTPPSMNNQHDGRNSNKLSTVAPNISLTNSEISNQVGKVGKQAVSHIDTNSKPSPYNNVKQNQQATPIPKNKIMER